MATTAQLMGSGFSSAVADLLGDKAVISRPTTAQLMGEGVPGTLADVLGNQWIAGNIPTANMLCGLGMAPFQAMAVTAGTSPGQTTGSSPGGGPSNMADFSDPNNAFLVGGDIV